jgi:ribosomal protein S18 acetylase RimI-like enzyme
MNASPRPTAADARSPQTAAEESAEIAIRLATPDDGDDLARMRWDFTADDGPPDGEIEPLESFGPSFVRTFRGYLASGRWRIWVAERRNEQHDERSVIGCVWVQWVDRVPRPTHRAHSLGYVTNVYVAPAWRNRGVGGRLLEAAVEDGRRIGHALMFLWPTEESVDFYRRAGFERSDELMEHSLFADGGEAAPT